MKIVANIKKYINDMRNALTFQDLALPFIMWHSPS